MPGRNERKRNLEVNAMRCASIGPRYASCIAVQSDDRNDSNHRLTSGIRHSRFRVATPAAIVAVYDCRARSLSLSFPLFYRALQSRPLPLTRVHTRSLDRIYPASSRPFFASLSDRRRPSSCFSARSTPSVRSRSYAL